MMRYVAEALAEQRAGTALPFATVLRESGRVIGSTRFGSASPAHRRIEIGCPGIRTHIQRPSNSAPHVQRTAESLREVAEYGAGKNVVVNLENDDLVSEDAFFLVKVIEAVNHPYLHSLPDFANSMMTGNADFNYRALEAMFQHAYCICHVKDGEADGHGKLLSTDMKKSFDILKASGYLGYCSMEFDAPGEPYTPTTRLIEQTLQYLE